MSARLNNGGRRILVAGASGQLAQSLARLDANADGATAITAIGTPTLDILDVDKIRAALDAVQPHMLVNAAAFTAVDRAQSDVDMAFAVNRDGPGNLAAAAKQLGIPVIHISTDYVFDGTKPAPYVETDTPAPQCVYGQSKYEGELAVADANPHHVIIRTAWVYSEYGGNFVKTMLRLAKEKPELRVVADQHGNPTHAGDLACAITKIAAKLDERAENASAWGVYHLAGQGGTTWHGLAQHVIDCTVRLGAPSLPVHPITTADFPTPAKRPANSRLDCSKAQRTFGVTMPRWQDSVERCVAALTPPQEQNRTGASS